MKRTCRLGLWVCLALGPALLLHAAAPTGERTRRPVELPGGWAPSGEPKQFIAQDLFNHIDGAAEHFIEMGFRRVTVQRYARGSATLDLEVYEMEDPTAARGTFLRFRGGGKAVPGVEGRNVGNRYQLIAQKGPLFVQVNNPTGHPEHTPAMAALANRVLNPLPEDPDVPVLKRLPVEKRVPGSEAIFRGPFGLQAVYTLGDGDVLLLGGQVFGVAADYKTDQDPACTLLIVPYPDPPAAARAFTHLLEHLDPHLRVLRRTDHSAIFQDATGKFALVTLRGDALEIHARLPSPPAGPPATTSQPGPQQGLHP